MSDSFWENKPLSEMDKQEWESLCDGCGLCCLIKLEDEDDGEIYFTDVACKLLDCNSCQCQHYPERLQHVPDCIVLTPELVSKTEWLPETCAYRLIRDGLPLFPWHPLISGDKESVHKAGISVRQRVVSESQVKEEDLEERVINWFN